MQHTVHSRESFLDVAVQECGTFEAAFDLAGRYDRPLTDELTVGECLEAAPATAAQRRIVAELAVRDARPATAITAADAMRVPWGGIGRMGIENDFKIS